MTVGALSSQFRYPILRGNTVLQDGIHVKARFFNLSLASSLNSSKGLVMEDLIQHVHTLFGGQLSLNPPIHSESAGVGDTSSALTHGSLFLSPEIYQSADIPATGTINRLGLELSGNIPTSTRSSFSSLPLDTTPPPNPLLSPLPLSQTLTRIKGGMETTVQEQVLSKPEVRCGHVPSIYLSR